MASLPWTLLHQPGPRQCAVFRAMVRGCGITAASCPRGALPGQVHSPLICLTLSLQHLTGAPSTPPCRLDRFQLHLGGGCRVHMCACIKAQEGSETGLVFLTLDKPPHRSKGFLSFSPRLSRLKVANTDLAFSLCMSRS